MEKITERILAFNTNYPAGRTRFKLGPIGRNIRVVAIQKRMQNRSPALLSTSIFRGNAYVMEEMQATDDKIDFKLLKHDFRDMWRVTGDMGALTAAAQLRSAGRQGAVNADELISFGKHPDWKPAIMQQATDYAHKMNAYYLQFISDHPIAAFKKQMQLNKQPLTAVK